MKLFEYAREIHLVFTHREYARLRKHGIGSSEVVETLVSYLVAFYARELASILTLDLVSIPSLLANYTEFTDSTALRQMDFLSASSWLEYPLILALRDKDSEFRSVCREPAYITEFWNAQILAMGQDRVSKGDRRDFEKVAVAAESFLGISRQQLKQFYFRIWNYLPETIWLVNSGKRVIGCSFILPLSDTAYEQVRSGQTSIYEFGVNELQIPSRNLVISGFVTFPSFTPPRLLGGWTAIRIRKLLQHGALLLGDDPRETRPLRTLTAIRNEKDEAQLRLKGYVDTGNCLYGCDNSKIYELVSPAPEQTVMNFSSAAAATATMIGLSWRQLNQ